MNRDNALFALIVVVGFAVAAWAIFGPLVTGAVR